MIKCLQKSNQEQLAITKWEGEITIIEIRTFDKFDLTNYVQIDFHANDIIELKNQFSDFYGNLIIGTSDGNIINIRFTDNYSSSRIVQ